MYNIEECRNKVFKNYRTRRKTIYDEMQIVIIFYDVNFFQINSIIEPFLIDLSQLDSSYLTFSPDNLAFYPESHSSTPLDVFSLSASRMNIPLFVNNELFYGYVMDWLQPLNIRRKLVN